MQLLSHELREVGREAKHIPELEGCSTINPAALLILGCIGQLCEAIEALLQRPPKVLFLNTAGTWTSETSRTSHVSCLWVSAFPQHAGQQNVQPGHVSQGCQAPSR